MAPTFGTDFKFSPYSNIAYAPPKTYRKACGDPGNHMVCTYVVVLSKLPKYIVGVVVRELFPFLRKNKISHMLSIFPFLEHTILSL